MSGSTECALRRREVDDANRGRHLPQRPGAPQRLRPRARLQHEVETDQARGVGPAAGTELGSRQKVRRGSPLKKTSATFFNKHLLLLNT